MLSTIFTFNIEEYIETESNNQLIIQNQIRSYKMMNDSMGHNEHDYGWLVTKYTHCWQWQ